MIDVLTIFGHLLNKEYERRHSSFFITSFFIKTPLILPFPFLTVSLHLRFTSLEF